MRRIILSVCVVPAAIAIWGFGFGGYAAVQPPAVVGTAPRPQAPAGRSAALWALLDRQYDAALRGDPVRASTLGDRRWSALLRDESPEAYAARRTETDLLLKDLGTLEAAEGGRWSTEDRADAALLRFELELAIEGAAFHPEQRQIDNKRGVQVDTPQMADSLPFSCPADYSDYASRLEALPRLVDQVIAQMRDGIKAKRVQPKVVMVGCVEQCRLLCSEQVAASPAASQLYKPFRKVATDSPDAVRARTAIANGIVPAYARLAEFLEKEYLPACRDDIAASAGPDGEAFYRHELRVQTTTDLTPQQIHEIGLKEVARIRAEMIECIARTDYPRRNELAGDELLRAFIEYLRTEPRFRYADGEGLLAGYRDIAKRVDAGLPALFGRLPRNTYGVREMPLISAKTGPTAYYFPGSLAGGVPGYFVANTYQPAQRPKYEMIALTMHEAVPGHHLQIALAQEMDGVHPYRRLVTYNAFLEGWALYAERLGLEIKPEDAGEANGRGLYADPYDDFGRLTYEMWRACRLVVDPGMHALGWSRERAVSFMKTNTALSELNIEREVDRYIGWPGQACGYKLGELKIRELRSAAEVALGGRFNLRAFHDQLLGAGIVPLPVVEQRMQVWITEAKQSPAPSNQ